MSLEENKTIIRKMIEAINEQNLALLDELIANDFVYHTAAQQIQGPKVMKQGATEEIQSFPDLCVTIENTMAEGRKAGHRRAWLKTVTVDPAPCASRVPTLAGHWLSQPFQSR